MCLVGNCPSGKFPSGKCLVGEISIGEVSVGEVSGRGNVHRGCVRRGNVRWVTVHTPLKQPRFIYSTCGPFSKNKERIHKFKETGDTSYIYKNELDKPCFQHDMAYGDFKDLARRAASDKVLRDKEFNNPKYDRCQRGLASTVYKFLDKKSK